jgi:hypothetical protein
LEYDLFFDIKTLSKNFEKVIKGRGGFISFSNAIAMD